MNGVVKGLFIFGIVLLVVGFGLSALYISEINQRSDLMGTKISVLEEWNSYQSTQIMAQQQVISHLATVGPAGNPTVVETPPYTLTPYDQIYGVMIEGNSCCVGGTAGETIEVSVQFFPKMNELPGVVVEMRVIEGRAVVTLADMADQPWEPFTDEKVFPVNVATNWTAFWVYVQFRTADGAESELYSDDIGVEGMPGYSPTP